MKNAILLTAVLLLLVSACSPMSPTAGPTATTLPLTPSDTPQPVPTATSRPSQTPLPSATATASATTTATQTLTPTVSATATLTPTYAVLRGEVIIERAVCHYGPGAPYLYKYGVVKGSNLEIIRRVELGNYIEVQAIGGNNPCWLRADYMDIKGDLNQVESVPADQVSLPFTPYYNTTLNGVTASRSGDVVTVSWAPFVINPGDDSEQYPYLLETWVCQNGEFFFNPVGTYNTSVEIVDEPGCSEQSWGRAYAVEKHGYTSWVKIPWPEQ